MPSSPTLARGEGGARRRGMGGGDRGRINRRKNLGGGKIKGGDQKGFHPLRQVSFFFFLVPFFSPPFVVSPHASPFFFVSAAMDEVRYKLVDYPFSFFCDERFSFFSFFGPPNTFSVTLPQKRLRH